MGSLEEALSLHRSGRRAEALEQVRAVLSREPTRVDALQLGATAAFELGRLQEALEFLQALAAQQPRVPELPFSIGNVLSQLERPAEAVAAFERALQLRPDFPKAAFNLAVTCESLNRREQALAVYGRLLTRHPNHLEALSNRARLLKQLGRFNEALADYRRALAVHPDHPVLLYNFGIAWRAVRRPRDAVDCFRKALAIRPSFAEALLELGYALYEAGEVSDAVAVFRDYLELRPTSAKGLLALGDGLQDLGKSEAALQSFEKSLAIDPELNAARQGRAAALLALDRLPEVEQVAEEMLSATSNRLAALGLLRELRRRQGRLDDVVEPYRQSIAAGSAPPKVYHALAEILVELDRKAEALELCRDCARRFAGDARALAYQAMLAGELDAPGEQQRLLDYDRLVVPQDVVAPVRFGGLTSFNEALAAHILSHPSLTFELEGTSTVDGLHSGELLIDPKGPIADFEQLVLQAVERYMSALPGDADDSFVKGRPQRWYLNVWSVVLGAAGYQKPHIHPSAWLSGVYYVQVPEAIAAPGEDQAGWIEFGRPSERLAIDSPPPRHCLQPRPGLMVLFPSYLYHRTIPFQSSEQRISIAFDVLPFSGKNDHSDYLD